ncbi:inositol 5-phosphatase [Cavenderia fasciculata]|uniref:Inositol 5-phosphatase n=1 Tax=Cavenderia fasciculata TaxID=261658 RepID=F4Q5F4_CACFS|nr:inositol 5-phosphatase [Cavenderia fasciculata]EGG17213.1 inositol 5-phosphatase [Cavenderia fasciculata]|eukprot:XP_004355697.1 inositol 5-phosphatase [Cavenderia fasciculata]
MTRIYVNNFKDNGRQDVLDQLLGIHATKSISEGGADDRIRKQVADRKQEYSQKEYKNVFIGTYNVGGVPSREFNLDSWLSIGNYPSPDLYVLGIQEVVELTAQQIIATGSQIKQWEETIQSSLERVNPKVRYVQLQSNQLVGLMMCIYVREDIVQSFREVQSQIIKVGLQGLAGNKGGIGVRLLLNDTSFTFVTAHFAAGHGNVEDRISDYKDINEQARFGRQSQYRIESSDYSFWFGDFNFRIDLADDDIRRSVINNNYALLYNNDQLKKNMELGNVFKGYKEDNILFAPTYKYDFKSKNYDTSPKQRAPAWTDRILWRNQKDHDLRQLYYNHAEILESDHRPVSTYLQLQVLKVDKEKERQLRHQLYEQQDKINVVDGANLTKSLSALAINQQQQQNKQPLVQSHSMHSIDTYNGNNNNGVGVGNPIVVSSHSSQPQSMIPPQVPQRRGSRPLPLVPIDQIVAPNTNTNNQQQRVNSLSPSKNLIDVDFGSNHSSTTPNSNHSRASSPSYFGGGGNVSGSHTPSPYSSSPSSHQFNKPQMMQHQHQAPQLVDDFTSADLFSHFNNNLPSTPSGPVINNNNNKPHNPYDNVINANLSYPPPTLVQSTTTVTTTTTSSSYGSPSTAAGLTPVNPFIDNSPMIPIQSNALQSMPSYHHQYPPQQMQQPPPPPIISIQQPPMVLLTPTPNPIIYQPPPHQQQFNMYQQQHQQYNNLPPPIDPININPNSQYLMNTHQQQQQQQLQQQQRGHILTINDDGTLDLKLPYKGMNLADEFFIRNHHHRHHH